MAPTSGSTVTISVTGTSLSAEEAIRRVNKQAKEAASDGLGHLKGALISLAPAAVPIAAQLLPIAAGATAAGVATAAFGAALIPQVKALGDVSKAQDAYTKAVTAYGPNSKQAAKANDALYDSIKSLPPATQQAAAAFLILKDNYGKWSDDLAKDTVPVFTKSLAVANALLPKTTGLVKGAAGEYDRLITLVGGAVASPGFDRLNSKFTDFATKTLSRTVDEVSHLMRVLSEGKADGPLAEVMDYVHQTGPEVRETLEHIAEAVLHIGQATAQAGPGMLTIVNALAELVSAVPAPVLARLVQLYTIFKLIGLASAGVTLASAAATRMGIALTSLGRAALAASSSTALVSSAFASLSTGAKFGVVAAGITAVVVALRYFQSSHAAPAVDDLSVALGRFGKTGAVTGALSGNLHQLSDSIAMVAKSSSDNKLVAGISNLGGFLGLSTGPSVGDAKKNFDALDKALASLVQNGHADLAAGAAKRLEKAFIAGGGSADRFKSKMNDYNSALADAAFEQQEAARSMGLFGEQSIEVQKKLDAQKKSAQGLQQAIFDLNDANRTAYSTEADFEQAIDDATAAIKDHRTALKASSVEQALGTEKGREAYQVLDKLASSAEAAASAALEQGKGQDAANRILIRAHDEILRSADAMGMSTQAARKFADQLLNIRDPKISVTARTDQIRAAIADTTKRLNALGKLHPSPKVTANIAQLKNVIADARARLNELNGKTVQTYIRTTYVSGVGNVAHEGGGYAHGGVVGAAVGGPRSNLTWVGEHGPELASLAPGSTVMSNPDSMRYAAQQGAGAGAGSAPIPLTINVDGRMLARVLIDPLRHEISDLGGNVQDTLGRRTF